PPCIERAVLRRGHEPGARIVGNAPFGPSLERCDESILRELLRSADVAREACEAGDDLGLLDAPDRVDHLVSIGSRHGSQLEQLRPSPQARAYLSAAATEPFGELGPAHIDEHVEAKQGTGYHDEARNERPISMTAPIACSARRTSGGARSPGR